MSTPAAAVPAPTALPVTRVRVFIDYWNFQLSLNQKEARARGVEDFRFVVDWKKVGPWLAQQACTTAGVASHAFEGVIIYTSYNPSSREGTKFRNWVTSWLNRQPGITVECRERKPRARVKCPVCHREIANCPHCTKAIASTVEKGVDTLIATDMVRLAWENAYDLAVLATSDSDLVPAVEFLSLKGRKVIQAGFPPIGVELATACWGSFDVWSGRKLIERAPVP